MRSKEEKAVSQVFQLLLWLLIVAQLLQGVRLLGAAAEAWDEAFQMDHALLFCGRYQAMAANLRDAQGFWRKSGCAADAEQAELVNRELDELLQAWRSRYPGFSFEHCSQAGPLQVRLHQERNPELDPGYPNWVAHYHE